MGLNVAQKYERKVDERFKLKELTGSGLNTDYNWEGVDTIKVYNINTVSLNDYTKSGSNRYGSPSELQDTLTSYQVTNDKAFTFTIDEFYKRSQMGAKVAGKALAREIDEVIVPAKDTQRLKVWAETAYTNSQVVYDTLSVSNAYSMFLDAQEKLDNEKVPRTNRVFYCSPAYFKNIKLDSNFIKASDIAMGKLINGQVGMIDGVKVVMVPASYLKTNLYGIIVYTPSTISPAKLQEYKIHDNPPGINGDLVEGRVMFDTFVLNAKKKGVVAIQKTASI
jgi:N4-gp56 family major capsid protein